MYYSILNRPRSSWYTYSKKNNPVMPRLLGTWPDAYTYSTTEKVTK